MNTNRVLHWRDWSLRSKTLAAGLFPILAIVINLVLVASLRSKWLEAQKSVVYTRDIQNHLKSLDIDLADAELALDHRLLSLLYLGTSQPGEVNRRILKQLYIIPTLVRDDAEQLQQARALQTTGGQWLELVNQIDSESSKGAPLPELSRLQQILSEQKQVLRNEIDRIMVHADTMLTKRRLHLANLQRFLFAMDIATLAFALLGAVWLSYIISEYIVRRVQVIGHYVYSLHSGDALPQIEPSGDELGQISTGLSYAAFLLKDRTKALENALDGIAAVNAQGRFTVVNNAYAAMFGKTPAQLVGQVWEETIAPPMREAAAEVRSQMEQQERFATEIQFTREDKSCFPAQITLVQAHNPDGEASGFYCFIHDLTEQKQASEQLQNAKEEAEAANQAKSEFLARMSHEIRTPLNAIIGFTDLLADTPLNEQQTKYLQLFQNSSHHLLALINDVLDLSKIEAGSLAVTSVRMDPRTITQDVVLLLEGSARSKGLALKVKIAPDIPPFILADPQRLKQILVNLLGNAIKFTETGVISLVLSRFEENGTEMLRFDVDDTGTGIRPEYLEQIFDPFSQGDTSVTRKYGGTGLGLSISRRLAEAMNGRLSVQSQQGRGSCFSLSIPLIQATPTELVGQRDRRLAGVRLLLAGNDAGMRSNLQKILASAGCAVTVAEWPLELLLKSSSFQIVLIQRSVSGVSGLGLAERACTQTPVLLLDSRLTAADRKRARQKGIHCLTESFPKRTLLQEEIWAAIQIQNPGPAPISERGGRVLAVDDHPANLLLIQEFLKSIKGLQLDVAENGLTALQLASEHHYDLILMDVQMPILDGFSATYRIREQERSRQTKPVPIVAFTASSLESERERCLGAGFDECLLKPAKRRDLVGLVTRYLNLSKQHEAELPLQPNPYLAALIRNSGEIATAFANGQLDRMKQLGLELSRIGNEAAWEEIVDTGCLIQTAAIAANLAALQTQVALLGEYASKLLSVQPVYSSASSSS